MHNNAEVFEPSQHLELHTYTRTHFYHSSLIAVDTRYIDYYYYYYSDTEHITVLTQIIKSKRYSYSLYKRILDMDSVMDFKNNWILFPVKN